MLSVHSFLPSSFPIYLAKVVSPSPTLYHKKVVVVALLALSLLCACYFLIKSYWFRSQLQNLKNINANLIHVGPINEQVKEETELYLDPIIVNKVLKGHLQAIPRLYPKLKKLSLGPGIGITDKDLQQLAQLSFLEDLNLTRGNLQFTAQGLAYLKNCSSLHTLRLSYFDQLTDDYLEHVKHLLSLRVLNLESCQKFTEKGLNHLTALPHLETLELSYCHQITNEYLKLLQSFSSLQNLKISSNNLKDKDLECLKDLSLRSLELSCQWHITDKGLEYLQTLPVRSLAVSYCNSLTSKGLENLKECPLENLNLSGCAEMTDDGLAHLQHISSLQVLNLANCSNLTDKGLEYLKGCPLKNLNLSTCTNMTDDGLAHLQHISSLQVLNLSGCRRLTEKGFAYLKALSNLQELNIEHCFQIKEEHLKQLKELSSLRVLKVRDEIFPKNFEKILKQSNPLLKIERVQMPR